MVHKRFYSVSVAGIGWMAAAVSVHRLQSPSAMGSSRNINMVGKVVSERVSRAVNVLFDLGKQYPNGIFSVFIKIEDLVNFGYEPVSFLKGKRIGVIGKVGDLGGKPVMYIGNGKDVEVIRWRTGTAAGRGFIACPSPGREAN